MKYPTIKAVDDQRKDCEVNRYSSIDQYNDVPIPLVKGGVVTPLSFDVIDYVGCDCLKFHQAALMPDGWGGYSYPVRECHYVSDVYAVFDDVRPEERRYPSWTGVNGTFTEYVNRPSMVNADNAFLGQRNAQDLKVGLDYVKAESMLTGVA